MSMTFAAPWWRRACANGVVRRFRALPPGFRSSCVVLLPAPAVCIGLLVMRSNGVETAVWGQNLSALLICTAGILVLINQKARSKGWWSVDYKLIPLMLAVLSATFGFPGLQGVHRWIECGLLRLHAAELILPTFLIATSSLREKSWALSWVSVLLAGVVLIFQPDAGQLTAFLVAVVILLRSIKGKPTHGHWPGLLVLIACLVIGWRRADPLGAVPHVEGIVGLASEHGTLWKIAAILSLIWLPIPFLVPFMMSPGSSRGRTGLALAIYFGLELVVCFTGRFPVPLMGYGISPFGGYYSAIAWLVATNDSTGPETAYVSNQVH